MNILYVNSLEANNKELARQLASCQAALADTEALEIGTGERLAKVEQQLAAALAACKLKDESLESAHNGLRWWMDTFPLHVTEADNEEMLKIVKALAIQPDASALKAWLGYPVAWLHEKRRDSDVITDAVKNVWNGVVVGEMAQYSIPLYAKPKGIS